MSQARIQQLIGKDETARANSHEQKLDIKALEEEERQETIAISVEVLYDNVLRNIKQKIPTELTKEQEAEFVSNLTRILNEENVPKALHHWVINHQLGAIKNLLKDFTVDDHKTVTYSKQKVKADQREFEAVDLSEEIYIKINLRLAREDSLTRGILKYVEEQRQNRDFAERAAQLQSPAPNIKMRPGR